MYYLHNHSLNNVFCILEIYKFLQINARCLKASFFSNINHDYFIFILAYKYYKDGIFILIHVFNFAVNPLKLCASQNIDITFKHYFDRKVVQVKIR